METSISDRPRCSFRKTNPDRSIRLLRISRHLPRGHTCLDVVFQERSFERSGERALYSSLLLVFFAQQICCSRSTHVV